MPTILDTDGIAQCVISYGKESSFAGKLANVSIQVTPMAAGIGPIRLVWAATGDIFSPFTDTTSGDSGAPGIITLPRTDQDGFRHGTSAFKNWYYLAIVTATLADGQQAQRRYVFQTPSTTLDLDMLDEDGVVAALPVIAPFLAEPAGLSDDTRAALSATYPAFRSSAPTAAQVAAGVVAYIDTTTVPPSLKGWNGSAWVAIGGSAPIADLALTLTGAGVGSLVGTGLTATGKGVGSVNSTLLTSIGGGVGRVAA